MTIIQKIIDWWAQFRVSRTFSLFLKINKKIQKAIDLIEKDIDYVEDDIIRKIEQKKSLEETMNRKIREGENKSSSLREQKNKLNLLRSKVEEFTP
jgi:Mg2+ and Co2+ transporter CorA